MWPKAGLDEHVGKIAPTMSDISKGLAAQQWKLFDTIDNVCWEELRAHFAAIDATRLKNESADAASDDVACGEQNVAAVQGLTEKYFEVLKASRGRLSPCCATACAFEQQVVELLKAASLDAGGPTGLSELKGVIEVRGELLECVSQIFFGVKCFTKTGDVDYKAALAEWAEYNEERCNSADKGCVSAPFLQSLLSGPKAVRAPQASQPSPTSAPCRKPRCLRCQTS